MSFMKDRRGIAIIITIIMLTTILAIAVGIASVFLREIRLSSLTDNSIFALMAADAGLERRLYEVRRLGSSAIGEFGPVSLPNGASFEICPSGAECRSQNPTRIISEGTFRDTRRSVQVEF